MEARGISVPSLLASAVWFFGVIVGLAINAALAAVIPQILDGVARGGAADLAQTVARLVTFLVLLVRFYHGSVAFFSDRQDVRAPRATASMHFFFGFFHFLMFFALAFTLDPAEARGNVFAWLLGFVLLYDIVWWLSSWKIWRDKEECDLVFAWMAYNAVWVAALGALIGIGSQRFGFSDVHAEILALSWIFLWSLVEMLDLAGPKVLQGLLAHGNFHPLGRTGSSR